MQVEIAKHLPIKDSVMLGSTCKHLRTLFNSKDTYNDHAILELKHELSVLAIGGKKLLPANIDNLFSQTSPVTVLQKLYLSKKELHSKVKTTLSLKKFGQIYQDALQQDDIFTVINLLQLCCTPGKLAPSENLYDYLAMVLANTDKCSGPRCQHFFTELFSHPVCKSMDEFYQLFTITPQWRQKFYFSLLPTLFAFLLFATSLYFMLTALPNPTGLAIGTIASSLFSLSFIPYLSLQLKFVKEQKQAIKNFFVAAQERKTHTIIKEDNCWQKGRKQLKAPFAKKEFGKLLALQLKDILEDFTVSAALDSEALKFSCRPSQARDKVEIRLQHHGQQISTTQTLCCHSLEIHRDNCHDLAYLCQLILNKYLNDCRYLHIMIEGDPPEALEQNAAERAPLLKPC
ncbi:MAG: hypothetical protein K0S08_323 [Gammaproteobacteria bacterium]|nr:hypothetical protein [Gammaproteobacteria bacterium]